MRNPGDTIEVECLNCDGIGYIGTLSGWAVPRIRECKCRECNGTGTVDALCSCCCKRLATVETDDRENTYLCDECDEEVKAETGNADC